MNSLLDHPRINDLSFTDKKLWHSYLPVYDKYLTPHRNETFNILEIGVSCGGSSTLWHDFCENIHIHAIDVLPEPILVRDKERITYYQREGTTTSGGGYDLDVIDDFIDRGIKFKFLFEDGPHSLETMIFVAQHYHRVLEEDGTIFIEDIKNLDWVKEIQNALPENMISKVYDLREEKGRFDDIVMAIKFKGQSFIEDGDA